MSVEKLKELVGVANKQYCFEVEKGKIREFAEAIGDDNPIYYDLEAAKQEGFKRIPIPFTFLQAIDLWGGFGFDEKMKFLKLDPQKVLHGEQEYEHLQDIYAGDVINVNVYVENVEVKQGSSGKMILVTLKHYYKNQKNEEVATAKSVLIQRD